MNYINVDFLIRNFEYSSILGFFTLCEYNTRTIICQKNFQEYDYDYKYEYVIEY